MCQNMCLHIAILLTVFASSGESRSHGQLPGPPQDGAAVGLDLYNEKCLNSNTTRCDNDSAQPSSISLTDISSKPLTSSKPSATTQSTTDSTADSTGQPFTSVKPSATTQPTTNSSADSTGRPFTSVQPSANSQPTPVSTYSGLYLYEASTRGDLASVNKALAAAGTILNWANPDKRKATPLHAAAQFNHPDVVTALLNSGADKDRQDHYGRTPLYYASEYGSTDVATMLIALGAIVGVPSNWGGGGRPLHLAARYNHTTIVTSLLDAGAEINRQDDIDWTPLHHASSYGSIGAASVLIARGASVDIPDKNYGRTALHRAIVSNHPAIVSALLDAGADRDRQDEDGATSLYLASGQGSIDAVNILIAHGASVDIPDKYYGRTALHRAIVSNHPAIVSALLDAGADRDRQDKDGATSLYLASISGSIDAVNILIACDSSVDTPRNDGTTPVAVASYQGYLDVVEALVAAKADVNIPNQDGFTALHQAAQNRWYNPLDIAKVLLRNGADASKLDNQGRTPAALAQEEGYQELLDIINGFTRTTDK